MKTAITKYLLRRPSSTARRFNAVPAFTLIELLVVIAMLAVLSAMFLPALAGSRAQPRVTACAANFRQWAVSVNLYANDHLDSLPRFDWNSGGGNFLQDVSINFIPNLAPYGLTIPMWFDPVRPDEYDSLAQPTAMGHFPTSIEELNNYLSRQFNECVLHYNWWVQRCPVSPPNANSIFPPDMYSSPVNWANIVALNPWIKTTPVANYGLPKKLHDNAAAHLPFVSCLSASALGQAGNGLADSVTGKASSNPADQCANVAHFDNGVFLGVNAAYADGHVESHNPSQMNCGYLQGGIFWFY